MNVYVVNLKHKIFDFTFSSDFKSCVLWQLWVLSVFTPDIQSGVKAIYNEGKIKS